MAGGSQQGVLADLGRRVERIHSRVDRIASLVRELKATPDRDTAPARDRVRGEIREQLAAIMGLIEVFKVQRPTNVLERSMLLQLGSTFRQVQERFRAVTDEFASFEKLPLGRGRDDLELGDDLGAVAGPSSRARLTPPARPVPIERQGLAQAASHDEDLAKSQAHTAEVQEMERELRAAREMFVAYSSLVDSQQVGINALEAHVEQTHDNVVEGNKNMAETITMHRKSRCILYWIIGLVCGVAIAGGIVAAILVWRSTQPH